MGLNISTSDEHHKYSQTTRRVVLRLLTICQWLQSIHPSKASRVKLITQRSGVYGTLPMMQALDNILLSAVNATDIIQNSKPLTLINTYHTASIYNMHKVSDELEGWDL